MCFYKLLRVSVEFPHYIFCDNIFKLAKYLIWHDYIKTHCDNVFKKKKLAAI